MDLRSLLFLFLISSSNSFILKQVVILSRHNVRTPLSKTLARMTPKSWPPWNEKSGYLTAKGALLEGYMGEFFSEWLRKEGLLHNECPSEDVLYVYANTAQRTMASAKAFVNMAFPKCNVSVHHGIENDPVFNPIIHNDSLIFKQMALDDMWIRLKSLHLNNSYEKLESILDYKNSDKCVIDKNCDMKTDKNQPYISVGTKPNLSGPLKISKSAIDSFIMENYQGLPLQDVAWGRLGNVKEWESIIGLSKEYHNVIFNTTLISKDLAKPLIKYLSQTFLNDNNMPKILLLMGHDANMYTVLNSMGFKPYNLKNQHEVTPAGGKIVFQKWKDDANDRYLLKIDYVYQSTDGMRQGKKLSMENPPEFTLLELNGCEIDNKGLCPWDSFKMILNSL